MDIRFVLYKVVDLFSFVLIARVITSWFRVNPYNPVIQFIARMTDPLLDKIRSFMPAAMTIDFSPIIALMLLRFLQKLILS